MGANHDGRARCELWHHVLWVKFGVFASGGAACGGWVEFCGCAVVSGRPSKGVALPGVSPPAQLSRANLPAGNSLSNQIELNQELKPNKSQQLLLLLGSQVFLASIGSTHRSFFTTAVFAAIFSTICVTTYLNRDWWRLCCFKSYWKGSLHQERAYQRWQVQFGQLLSKVRSSASFPPFVVDFPPSGLRLQEWSHETNPFSV